MKLSKIQLKYSYSFYSEYVRLQQIAFTNKF